jgi:transposase
MPRLRQNDRQQAMGMVQAGMTHQAVADHLNVSRMTISRLMVGVRQASRTNDRPRNGRPCMTSKHQDRHLRLIHLRNRMITAEDTTRSKTWSSKRPNIGSNCSQKTK